MKLKDMSMNDLVLFYYFLDENGKYNNIENLKKAILSRLLKKELDFGTSFLDDFLRSVDNE